MPQVVAQRPMATSTWQLETISITAASTGITSWFFANHVFSNAAEAAVMLEASETDITAQMAKYKVSPPLPPKMCCKQHVADHRMTYLLVSYTIGQPTSGLPIQCIAEVLTFASTAILG